MHQSLHYQLSLWAKNHRIMAITAIIIAKLGLACIGFSLGLIAWFEGISLPHHGVEWLLFTVAVGCIVAYPNRRFKNRWNFHAFYRRQKTIDGILVALGFATFFFLGNVTPSWTTQPASAPVAVLSIQTAVSSLEKPVSERRQVVVKGGKIRQWLFQKATTKLRKVVARFDRFTKENRAISIILAIITCLCIATVLGWGVLVLSCHFSCSGQEALAWVVLILGAIGIISLAILIFRTIVPRSKRKEKAISQ